MVSRGKNPNTAALAPCESKTSHYERRKHIRAEQRRFFVVPLNLLASQMPGYRAVPVHERAGLVCPHCELLLRSAVQTDDGVRLCQSCFKEIAEYVWQLTLTGFAMRACATVVTAASSS